MPPIDESTSNATSDLVQAHAEVFRRLGVSNPSPIQRRVIAAILAAAQGGEACPRLLAHMPTGSGKSLIFMAAGEILGECTLVVYPLLALMDDQMRRFRQAGMAAAVLRGGQTPEKRRELLNRVRQGAVRFLLLTPEILASTTAREVIAAGAISHAVIDEAHIVQQWGESFRPAYRMLGSLLRDAGIGRISAFSVTAGPGIQSVLRSTLFLDEDFQLFEDCMDRPNIQYRTLDTPCPQASLYSLIRHGEIERPLLIFARTRRRVAALAAWLQRRLPGEAEKINFYHAGLELSEKEAIADWYAASTDGILCATCAYGMGVDKSNIRTVVHYDMPETVEAFLQESGRGGRDRQGALSLVLLGNPGGLERTYASLNQCRRRWLLAELGSSTSVADNPGGRCCDVCDQAPAPLHPDWEPVKRWLQRQPWTRRPDEILHRLLASPAFAGWTLRQGRRWLEALLERRIVLQSRFPLWRDTCRLGR